MYIWSFKIEENFVARDWIRKFGRSHGGVNSWLVRIEKLRRHDMVKTFSPWTSLGGMFWETALCLLVHSKDVR